MASFEFIVKLDSNTSYFNIGENNPRFFNQVSLYDSILDFYPSCEIIFPDNTGLLTNKMFPVEFTDLNIQFGVTDIGFFNHKFYFSDNNTLVTNKKEFISADYFLPLQSTYEKQDEEKINSFNTNLSSVVSTLINRYDFPEGTNGNLQVSNTDNIDYWYQADETDKSFIDNHIRYAYSPNYPKSPFVSFFTLDNKFYFVPIEELMRQTPIATFELTENPNTLLNNNEIIDYEIQNMGTDNNKENYNKGIFRINNNLASSTEEAFLLKDHIVHLKADKSDKFMIRSQDLKKYKTEYYGIYENKDINNYKGFSNYSYIDSYLPHRIDILTSFRPDVKTGSVVSISTKDSFENTPVETYQNNWLVISSVHSYFDDGRYNSKFTLGRNTMPIIKTHPLYNDLLSQ